MADLDGGDLSREDVGMDSQGTSTAMECLREAPAGMPEPHRIDGKLSTRLIVLLGSCRRDVIVRPLSTVGYTSVVASVIHSRQWSN